MNEKNFLQDVIPPAQKRSIRDIPVPARKKLGIRKPLIKSDEIKVKSDLMEKKVIEPNLDDLNGNNYKKNQKIKNYLKIFSVVIALVILFVVFSNLDSAKVTIEPKVVEAVVKKNISIGDLAGDTSTLALGYRTIELDKEVSKTVESDSEEFIQSKASGTITIYNEYSDKTQNLIKNTRFESPQGLIYTIQSNVAVPGYKMVDGKKVAGSIDAKVVASAAGENYNVDSTSFTIPGFKGQEPYELFGAKSKTPISGGFDGVKKIVSKEKIDEASVQLKQSARDALVADLQSQVSDEFVVLFDSNSFTFGQITETQEQNSNNVVLKLKGNINAKVFNKVDLSNAIASGSVIDYSEGNNVLIKDIKNIELSILNNELVVDNPLIFVWQNNIENIKQALVNKKKSEFGSLIKALPGISKADSIVKPFWKTRFPENTKDIEVVIVNN